MWIYLVVEAGWRRCVVLHYVIQRMLPSDAVFRGAHDIAWQQLAIPSLHTTTTTIITTIITTTTIITIITTCCCSHHSTGPGATQLLSAGDGFPADVCCLLSLPLLFAPVVVVVAPVVVVVAPVVVVVVLAGCTRCRPCRACQGPV
jgi:cobalamin synthase